MPLMIMKLAMDAATTTNLSPIETKFFSVAAKDVDGGDTLTITAEEFFNETGDTADTLPALNPDNSKINLFINGVLQMDGIYAYTPGSAGTGSIVIAIPTQGSIIAGSPIVLKITNYTPASATFIHT